MPYCICEYCTNKRKEQEEKQSALFAYLGKYPDVRNEPLKTLEDMVMINKIVTLA